MPGVLTEEGLPTREMGILEAPAFGNSSGTEAKVMQGRALHWNTYRIANMDDMPGSIELALINRVDKPIGGAGEPAIVCFPAAIANAVFDATGIRMRRYPLTPALVKKLLA